MRDLLFRYRTATAVVVFALLFGGAYLVERFGSARATELYFYQLSPDSNSINVYPSVFSISFNQPVREDYEFDVTLEPFGFTGPTVIVDSSNVQASFDQLLIDVNAEPANGEYVVANSTYYVYVPSIGVVASNSSDYYQTSGSYWDGTGGPGMYQWTVTFANPFGSITQTPSGTTSLDALTDGVGISFAGVSSLAVGNGIEAVKIRACDTNSLIYTLATDRPTGAADDTVTLDLGQAVVEAALGGTYVPNPESPTRCVYFDFPKAYARHGSYQLGSPARHGQEIEVKYLAHERVDGNGETVSPRHVFAVDFNEQIELETSTTTALELYDVAAAQVVASLPLVASANVSVGDGSVNDGVSSDTLYFGFDNFYELEAGKTYRIQFDGYGVRKKDSWDYVRYEFDGSDLEFIVEVPAAEPEPPSQDSSRSPSGRRARSDAGDVPPVVTALVSAAERLGIVPVERDLQQGATGADVKDVQRALDALGFSEGETSGATSARDEVGYYGTSTMTAVARFQANFGITPAFGYLGPITRALLGYILGW